MSNPTKSLSTSVEYKDAGDTGSVIAKFSSFDLPDREGDIVRRSAFTDGQQVPMVWAHDWKAPIGRGVIRVADGHAQFEGSFFPTVAGQEARQAVKAMGELQQWSWGFQILDTQPNREIKGYDITKAEVFEVSPVLVGANQRTATLAIKAHEPGTGVEEIIDLAQEVMELPGLDPLARALALQERAAVLVARYSPAPSINEELLEATKTLAREQHKLESVWLG